MDEELRPTSRGGNAAREFSTAAAPARQKGKRAQAEMEAVRRVFAVCRSHCDRVLAEKLRESTAVDRDGASVTRAPTGLSAGYQRFWPRWWNDPPLMSSDAYVEATTESGVGRKALIGRGLEFLASSRRGTRPASRAEKFESARAPSLA